MRYVWARFEYMRWFLGSRRMPSEYALIASAHLQRAQRDSEKERKRERWRSEESEVREKSEASEQERERESERAGEREREREGGRERERESTTVDRIRPSDGEGYTVARTSIRVIAFPVYLGPSTCLPFALFFLVPLLCIHARGRRMTRAQERSARGGRERERRRERRDSRGHGRRSLSLLEERVAALPLLLRLGRVQIGLLLQALRAARFVCVRACVSA